MSLPLARTLTIPTPWQAESPPAFARLFDYATDSFSLALLPSVAHSHLQSTLTTLVARTISSVALLPSSPLSTLARARWRASTVRGSDAILRLRTRRCRPR